MIFYICMGFYRECSKTFCSATVRERHHRLQQLLTILHYFGHGSSFRSFQRPQTYSETGFIPRPNSHFRDFASPNRPAHQNFCDAVSLAFCVTPTVATSCHPAYRSSLMTYTNLRPYGISVRPMVRFLIARHLFLIDLEPLY